MTKVQGYYSHFFRQEGFRYSVGDTLEEAKQNNCDIQIFKQIDLDGNGILSQEEILKGKLALEKKNSKGFSFIPFMWGALVGGTGGLIKKFGSKTPKVQIAGTLAMIGGAILAGVGAYSLITGKNPSVSESQKELERYYTDKEAQAKDEKYKRNISSSQIEEEKDVPMKKQEEAKQNEIPPDTSTKKHDDEHQAD